MLDGLALVIFLFAAGGGNDQFNVATTGEELGGDVSVAVFFGAGELGNLFFGGEKFDVAGGFGAESEIIEP